MTDERTDRGELGGRRFYRDRERGKIAGVCAGIAEYFGFNLCVTRLLAVVALIAAGPIVLVLYLAVTLLVPARPRAVAAAEPAAAPRDEEFRRALRAAPQATIGDVKRRFQRLDARLARLERYVTSPRFDLEQEFRKL